MAWTGVMMSRRTYRGDFTTTTTAGNAVGVGVTSDIKPQWLNVARRLQAACSGYSGHVVLSMKILVDGTGAPICWSEPNRTKVEPKSLSTDALLGLIID